MCAFEALGVRFSLIFEPPEAMSVLPQRSRSHRIMRNMRGAFQVAGLTLMIRATSSRSTERADLIICFAIYAVQDLWRRLTSAAARASSIASQNGLRSTSLCRAFFSDFGGIWGGFGRPKRRPKSIFEEVFVASFCSRVSASIFCGI